MRVPPDARIQQPGAAGLRAYARSLRSPKQNTWYGDTDPRSWRVTAQLIRSYHLSWRDIRRGRAVVRSARANGRYLCTLPRSGTNWLFAMLECGLSLANGGSGSYELVPARTPAGDDEWVFEGPRYGWPALPRGLAMALEKDRSRELGAVRFLYGHEPLPQGIVDYRRAHTVLSIRDPFTVACSLLRKDGVEWTLEEPGRLDSTIDRVEKFFGTWERRLDDPAAADRTLVIEYDDLRADPVQALVQIDRHWRLGVDLPFWEQAAERCSWGEMERAAGERRGTVRISLEQTEIPADVLDDLHERCDGLDTGLRKRAAGG